MNKQVIERAIEALNDFNKCVKAKADGAYETNDFVKARELVISALEKQIPKKPELVPEPYDDGIEQITRYIDLPYCPNCGDLMVDFTGHKHCTNCGQAIDWSVGNE